MIAYKGTRNFQCKGIDLVEIGQTYEIDNIGFSFSENIEDVNYLYDLNSKDTKIIEIKVLGDVITEKNKSFTDKFKVLREVPREEWKGCQFDSNGNLLLWEDSKGYWEKWEYDENNNEIYHEDSTGFWQKRVLDQNHYLINYEESNGFWEKYGYDSYECNKKIVSEIKYRVRETDFLIKKKCLSRNRV